MLVRRSNMRIPAGGDGDVMRGGGGGGGGGGGECGFLTSICLFVVNVTMSHPAWSNQCALLRLPT